MPVDQNMLQMMALMGGAGSIGQMVPEANMLQRAQGIPHINPGSYAQGYEIRKAIRGGIVGNQPGGMRSGSMGRPGAGGMEAMPHMGGGGLDPSSITDPSVANSALQPYGLQLPTHTNPFLFFNDRKQDGTPTWAGNHPRAAKAVEGAMIGLTTEGGNTLGQSISNVARTVLGVPGMYRQNQAAQMQAPFDQARQIGALQDDEANRQLKMANAFHMIATGQQALEKQPATKATIPMTAQDGTIYGYDPNDNSMSPTSGAPTGGINRVGTPPKPTSTNALPKWVKTVNQQAAFFEYTQKGGEFDEGGLPKDKLGYNNLVTKYTSRNAAAAGGGSTSARKSVDADYGALSDTDKTRIASKKEAVTNAKAFAEQKLSSSDFINSPDIVAAKAAEKDKRNKAWQAAQKDYEDTVSGLSGGSRNSQKTPSSPSTGSKPGVIVHPDGRVEVKP